MIKDIGKRIQIQPIRFPRGIFGEKLTPEESLNIKEVRKRLLPDAETLFNAENGYKWKIDLEGNILTATNLNGKKTRLYRASFDNKKGYFQVTEDLEVDKLFSKIKDPWAIVIPISPYSDKHKMLAYLGQKFTPGLEDISKCNLAVVKKHIRKIIDELGEKGEDVYFGWNWSPWSWGKKEEKAGYQSTRIAHVHIWTWPRTLMRLRISPKVKDPISAELAEYLGFKAYESGVYTTLKENEDPIDSAITLSRKMRDLTELLIRLVWNHDTSKDLRLLKRVVAGRQTIKEAIRILRRRWRMKDDHERERVYIDLAAQGFNNVRINALKRIVKKILKSRENLRQGLGFTVVSNIREKKLFARIGIKIGPGGPVETLGVVLERPRIQHASTHTSLQN